MKNLFSKLFNISNRHLLFAFVIISVIALLAPPMLVGDGLEYIAMTNALAKFRLPAYTPEELQEFYYWSDRLPYFGFDFIRLDMPSLVGFDNRQDFPHFWFYSLLCVPFWWILELLRSPTVHAFTLLNLSLLGIALRIGATVYSPTVLFLLLASPIVWFTNKAHTEIFTFSLVIIGVTLVARSQFLLAATAFAIASTQNIPWIPIVFILCGLSLIQKTYLFASIIPKIFSKYIKSQRKLINSSRSEQFKYLALLVFTVFLSLLHPIYYFIRLQAVTPQVVSGAVAKLSPDLNTYFYIIIDPDIGLFANFPLQSLLALFAISVLLLPLFFTNIFKRIPSSLINQILCGFGFTLFSAWLLYSFAKTANVNHGGTIHTSRYVIWLVPLLMPYLYIYMHTPILGRVWRTKLVNLVLPIIFVICIVNYSPAIPQTYQEQTIFSRFFYNSFPCVYQPVPEIFVERMLNIEIREQSVANKSCSLSFIKYGIFPKNCSYSQAEQVAIQNHLNAGTTASWITRQGTLNLCRPQVLPLANRNLINEPILDLTNANVLDPKASGSFLAITGMSDIEGTQPNQWRWGLGAETALVFRLAKPQPLELSFAFNNPIDAQDILIEANGSIVDSYTNLRPAFIDRSIKIDAREGLNRIIFRAKDWNNKQVKFAPNDPRPMSISFTRLLIEPADIS